MTHPIYDNSVMHDIVHHVLSKMYPGRVLVSSDAQIVILDAQNQSKQVDFESCFQI